MNSRVCKNEKIPKKVQKLMQKEKRRELREQFCSMFEDTLVALGKRNLGIPIENKISMYPQEAYETLVQWATLNNLPLVCTNNPSLAFQSMLENAVNNY